MNMQEHKQMLANLLVKTLLSQMGTIEEKNELCFQDIYPDLDRQCFEALNTRNVKKLRAVIRILDDLV